MEEFHEVGKFRPPNMHELYPSVTHFVVAADSIMHDRDVVLAYARHTCSVEQDDQVCMVLFWTDASRAATGFPITSTQQDAIVASYNRNRSTGKDGFQYYRFPVN